MISKVSKSKPEGLKDNFALSKEEFKVEKTLENEKVDFSKLKDIFNKIEDDRFI